MLLEAFCAWKAARVYFEQEQLHVSGLHEPAHEMLCGVMVQRQGSCLTAAPLAVFRDVVVR